MRFEGGEPVGPVTGELLRKGIVAGRVPLASEVRRVDEPEWQLLTSVPDFAESCGEAHPMSRPPLCTLPGIGPK